MTTDEQARFWAKVQLLGQLRLLAACIQFYGWGRILGHIPEHPGPSTQV